MRKVKSVILTITVLFMAAYQSGLKENDRIIFFGDSITQLGENPGGYVRLVRDSLTSKYKNLNLEIIGAGISGHKVPDLIARLDKDVLSKQPTIVVIYIGINDVWHWDLKIDGTTKEKFEEGLKFLIGKINENNARVILCTPSVVGERSDSLNKLDKMLDEYADISRRVAKETGSSLCDLRSAFLEYELANNPKQLHEGILTYDGVHLSAEGNRFVAKKMIEALEK
ncbi:MAG: G-D-S-L family lipolytic protein [Ignavibacteriales bacterium]|nr:MAG: G-D-S-L family lipolytic protein [Ignavibacteriales bacterium]